MNKVSLNGNWKLHWSTGQRGGAPYVYKAQDNSDYYHDINDIPHSLQGSYKGGWLDAEVPGEVHMDLMRAGILEDINCGINVLKARWVEEMIWYYRRTFDVPKEAMNGKVFLHFEELDLVAKIYLNGEEIARHENAFYPLDVNVSGKLKECDNELVVCIESGLYSVCERDIRKKYSATADMGLLLTKRMWLRKPQYEAEWDWSPRLMNVGISGDVELRYDPVTVIEHWQIKNQVSTDLKSAEIMIQLFPSAGYNPDREYILEFDIDGKTYSSVVNASSLCVTASLENPRLWYPIGYGEQELYDIRIRLVSDNTVVWEKNSETGFRLVEIDHSPHPEKGHYFTVKINHRPVFLKGGNFVPASLIPSSVTSADYEKLVDRAIELNFNMLRIWGGGVYEKEEFYNICNHRGIVVWQEFISACAYPPYEDDEKLYKDMIREAIYQVRRLSRNPSLVVWCGNNELDPYGHDLYMKDYPSILKENDPEKYYQPASPYTDRTLSNNVEDNNESYTTGDQHPWEVGFLNKDHRLYREMDCRFPNEGGILGPTNRQTFKKICDVSGDYTHTLAYEMHDNTLAYMREGTSPDDDLYYWCKKRPQDIPFEEYLVAGGFVQGEGLSDYIDNFRSRAYSSSSAIFWMFNDCWPCSRSWTVIDNECRRNLSFYHVKRAFAPLRIMIKEQDKEIKVMGINDSDEKFEGKLISGMFLDVGDMLNVSTLDITLEPRSVEVLNVIHTDLCGRNCNNSIPIVFAELRNFDGKVVSRNRLLTHRYFEYSLRTPKITVKEEEGKIIFLSDVYVMGVCLDLDGCDGLEDNLFDLFPGIPYTIDSAERRKIMYTMNDILKSSL